MLGRLRGIRLPGPIFRTKRNVAPFTAFGWPVRIQESRGVLHRLYRREDTGYICWWGEGTFLIYPSRLLHSTLL